MLLFFPLALLSANENDVNFRNFAWGTSMDDVVRRMGRPVSREEHNGLISLVWENVEYSGYLTYMLCYFSPRGGLQGGTYYFVTRSQDELMRCYSELQRQLRTQYGPTDLQKKPGKYNPAELMETITKELRPYDTSWLLASGYVHLRVNTRLGEPVTLWYSSPELTEKILGRNDPLTARK